MPGTESVKVLVRVRPLSADEHVRGCQSILQVDTSTSQVTVSVPKSQTSTVFSFNCVFPPETQQQTIYDQAVFPLVESVLEGYNGTVFAYGQTGCGKTYTMTGDMDSPGVIPNSFKHIFGAISDTDRSKCFLVRCSYMEIYNEEIRDLLHYDGSTKLELKEGKDQAIHVKGLSLQTVGGLGDLVRAVELGSRYRVTKETLMNERSSRSHAIFTVYLERSEEVAGRTVVKAGKLNLVDLAGSERQRKTQAAGNRLREAIEINLSLSALGNVITALVDGKSPHIPYRDSKLTRLLQDSLGGNTKTIMIAVVSPADYSAEESLSTLRYASRARRIQNKPVVNEDPKDALLRAYAEEIAQLKRLLSERPGATPLLDKYLEKDRLIDPEVPIPALVDPRKRIIRDPGKSLQRTAKKVAVILEDDSDDEPIVPKKPINSASKSSSKAHILEDDSSGSETMKKDPSIPHICEEHAYDESPIQVKPVLKPAIRPINEEKKTLTRRDVRSNRNSHSPVVWRPGKEDYMQQSGVPDMLAYITEKLITGGQLIEETEQERLKEYHRLQLQLQSQKTREIESQETKRKQETEFLLQEKQYQSLNEEVEEQRKVIKALREKYQSSVREMKDLECERETEKEDLLEVIRVKDKELTFYQSLMRQFVPQSEIVTIQQKSKYDENNRNWEIPPFVRQQNKQIVFPKVQKKQEEVEWGEDTLSKYQWLTNEGKQAEADNRPTTSGHRSRLVSRHSRHMLLEPLPIEKSPSTLPSGLDCTPLAKKPGLRPADTRSRKAVDVSVR